MTTRPHLSLYLSLTVASLFAHTACTSVDSPVHDAPMNPLQSPSLSPGSGADLLDWYGALQDYEQDAVLDVLIAHADSMTALDSASLAQLRAHQTDLFASLEAALDPATVAAFPTSRPLGTYDITRPYTGARIAIDDDEHDHVAYYGTSTYQWNHTDLTYCIDGYLDGMSNDAERNQYRNAGEEWASHSSLTFTKISSCSDADIKIKAKSKDHNEDGCGGFSSGSVLAHAQYPTLSNSRLYMHMNKKFDWANVSNMSGWDKLWNPDTYDLRTVAMHEFGHNIGITHSTSGNAVMHSTIGALETKWNLHSDDIAAVQALYPPDAADAAYARASQAQALVSRSLLLFSATAEDSPENRAAFVQLADNLSALDTLVSELRELAIAERTGLDVNATAYAMARVTEVLHQTWQDIDAARASRDSEALHSIAALTEQARLSIETAGIDLAAHDPIAK